MNICICVNLKSGIYKKSKSAMIYMVTVNVVEVKRRGVREGEKQNLEEGL